ncbi:TRAP transporter small permease subunit [Marinobacterium arenosum]|uniref:TRAP transporter small permease subunit n=1 Tax=Marinobacterium arenosum TaxID=2862496 RepID=UPI001C97812C|nr:TRAP transporter small permease subunit [Marinobacterium arenosum]MBY4676302.1 TRAP transporter small permease subunit [Marinobacterium arenosum]
MFLLRLESVINRFSDLLGKVSAILFVLMLFNVFYDVIMRYLFNDVSIGMQELEWHLFAAMFMLGVPYTLKVGGHVRVDLIYERLSGNQKAWIDLAGTLGLLLPFCLLVGWYGVGFAREAFELGETSGDPGGLPYRWIIKAVIPFAFFSMAISGVGLLLRSINTLRGHHPVAHYQPPSH